MHQIGLTGFRPRGSDSEVCLSEWLPGPWPTDKVMTLFYGNAPRNGGVINGRPDLSDYTYYKLDIQVESYINDRVSLERLPITSFVSVPHSTRDVRDYLNAKWLEWTGKPFLNEKGYVTNPKPIERLLDEPEFATIVAIAYDYQLESGREIRVCTFIKQ